MNYHHLSGLGVRGLSFAAESNSTRGQIFSDPRAYGIENYEEAAKNKNVMVGTTLGLYGMSVLAVCIRTWVRIRIFKKFTLDDWMMVGALVCLRFNCKLTSVRRALR